MAIDAFRKLETTALDDKTAFLATNAAQRGADRRQKARIDDPVFSKTIR